MCPLGTKYNYSLACDTAERIIFAVVAGSGSGKLCWHSPFIRQRRQKAMPARIRGKSQLSIAREGFLDRRSKRCFWLLLSPQTKVARAGARNYPRRRQRKRLRRGSGELAFPWRGGALRRPHFFLRRKKCGKESRLDLRSKGPLARYGSCKIGGADLAELVRRVSLSVRGTACTSCAAAADSSEGRGWCAGRF